MLINNVLVNGLGLLMKLCLSGFININIITIIIRGHFGSRVRPIVLVPPSRPLWVWGCLDLAQSLSLGPGLRWCEDLSEPGSQYIWVPVCGAVFDEVGPSRLFSISVLIRVCVLPVSAALLQGLRLVAELKD